jgi:hypothetical protein
MRAGESQIAADSLRRTFGIDVLSCPTCQTTTMVLAITTAQLAR